MSKNYLDLSQIENVVYKNKYKLSDVKDQIEKVAFDIVRFKDDDKAANLWQIQSADDGDYIIALYDQSAEELNKEASLNSWSVVLDKLSNNLHISYKGDPIVRVASNKLGIPGNELNKVAKTLPKKLAENKKLVKALLKELDSSNKELVLNKYPELS